MTGDDPHAVTTLLRQRRDGDRTALDRLMPLVYEELRAVAGAAMRAERSDHTLQPTALVHEAYERLVKMEVDFADRVHFFAVAARAMRRILVDHAKARGRTKRGGGRARLSLEQTVVVSPEPSPDLLALDAALTRLAAFDRRKSRAVELHYFGGLSYTEAAAALDISPATLHRELKLAKAWLNSELGGEPEAVS